MEIVGSIILSITQSILFYGKEIGISMLLFEIICNGIVYYILYKKNIPFWIGSLHISYKL